MATKSMKKSTATAKKSVKKGPAKAAPKKAAKKAAKAAPKKAAKKPAPYETMDMAAMRNALERRILRIDACYDDADLTMPVDVAVHEAAILHHFAIKYRDGLGRLPDFDLRDLDDLPVLFAYLDQMQGGWISARRGQALAQHVIHKAREEAEGLRAQFVLSGRYLLRNIPEGMAEIERISEGDGLPDLLADLKDMLAARQCYPEVWAKDIYLPKKVDTRLKELLIVLSPAADSADAIAAQRARNRAFFALTEAVHQVREGMRYLLRNDHKSLAPMLSKYEANRKRRARANKVAKPTAS